MGVLVVLRELIRQPRPLAVIRNRRLNSVALLAPLRSVQFSLYLPSVLVGLRWVFFLRVGLLADRFAFRVWCVGQRASGHNILILYNRNRVQIENQLLTFGEG